MEDENKTRREPLEFNFHSSFLPWSVRSPMETYSDPILPRLFSFLYNNKVAKDF